MEGSAFKVSTIVVAIEFGQGGTINRLIGVRGGIGSRRIEEEDSEGRIKGCGCVTGFTFISIKIGFGGKDSRTRVHFQYSIFRRSHVEPNVRSNRSGGTSSIERLITTNRIV